MLIILSAKLYHFNMFFAPWPTKRTTFHSNDNNKYDNIFDNNDNKFKIGFMVSGINCTFHNVYVLKTNKILFHATI